MAFASYTTSWDTTAEAGRPVVGSNNEDGVAARARGHAGEIVQAAPGVAPGGQDEPDRLGSEAGDTQQTRWERG